MVNKKVPKFIYNIFGGFRHKYDENHFVDMTKIKLILDHIKEIWCKNDEKLNEFLLKRDAMQKFQVDAANFFYLAPEKIIALFPNAKFILSVRMLFVFIISKTFLYGIMALISPLIELLIFFSAKRNPSVETNNILLSFVYK